MFSGETNATGETFNEAKLVTVTPSATNPDLVEERLGHLPPLLGTDEPQGAAAANYIKDTLKAKKVFVVDDASEYGKFLAEKVDEGSWRSGRGHRHYPDRSRPTSVRL